MILFVLWVVLKIYKKKWGWRQWWVQLEVEPVPRNLMNRLRKLENMSEKGRDRQPAAVSSENAVRTP